MSDPSQFLLYTAPDGAVKVDVLFREETAWLTRKALAELFGVKVPAVNKHLKNGFESGELAENSVVSILEIVRAIRGTVMKTTDWAAFLNAFMELSNYPILQGHGKVTALEAKLKAEGESESYREIQDQEYLSDFCKEIKRIQGESRP